MGATCTTIVANELLGQAFQALEHAASIHVLSCTERPAQKVYVLVLRSGEFPAHLAGKRIDLAIDERPSPPQMMIRPVVGEARRIRVT